MLLLVFLVPPSARAETAPVELTLRNQAGEVQKLSQYRGQIVVLNFWATWCRPCEAEMGLLVEARKRYANRGVVVIGASLDDDDARELVAKFVRRHKIKFPIWVGADPQTLKQLGLGESLPATAFIAPEGQIVARVLGELRKRELFERIDWLVGGRKGPAPPALLNHLK